MRAITSNQARRYRRIHAWLWTGPIALFFACLLGAAYAEDGSSAHLTLALIGVLGGGIGLLVLALFQRWLLRYIDAERELRSRVLRLSWLRAFGSFWAVRELLDQSVLRGGETPSQ